MEQYPDIHFGSFHDRHWKYIEQQFPGLLNNKMQYFTKSVREMFDRTKKSKNGMMNIPLTKLGRNSRKGIGKYKKEERNSTLSLHSESADEDELKESIDKPEVERVDDVDAPSSENIFGTFDRGISEIPSEDGAVGLEDRKTEVEEEVDLAVEPDSDNGEEPKLEPDNSMGILETPDEENDLL